MDIAALKQAAQAAEGAELPPLPEPWQHFPSTPEGSRNHYAEDQMIDYARAAVAASNPAVLALIESHEQLVAALAEALATIDDYLAYEHDGDPWKEDARAMGEMDIDDYSRDGRLEKARVALAAAGAA